LAIVARFSGTPALDEPTASPWRQPQTWEAAPGLAGLLSVAAVGRIAGNDIVVAACADNSLRLLDPNTGQPIQPPMYGHTGPATALAIGRIAGDDVIVVAWADNSLQIWDPHTGRHIQTLSHSLDSVIALAIGKMRNRDFIVVGSSDQTTWFWEVLLP
jgi:WD40 repeat protein